MPDWKRLVVGDAFRLPSRNFDYYRDLLLASPFLIFAIAGILRLFDHRWVVGADCIGISVIALSLARERLLLFLGALAFCALRFLIAVVLTQDWRGYVGFITTVTLLVAFGRLARNHKPSYNWPEGSIAELLLGLTSFILALKVFLLIDR